jgi:two-component system, LytTR family, sensor kinase
MDSARVEARRHVRRKRTFYVVLLVYIALVALWFIIDVSTGSDDWWFYWPTLGAGVIVAIIGLSMFGVSGLFGGDWQQREEEKYLRRHDSTETPDDGSTSIPPPP